MPACMDRRNGGQLGSGQRQQGSSQTAPDSPEDDLDLGVGLASDLAHPVGSEGPPAHRRGGLAGHVSPGVFSPDAAQRWWGARYAVRPQIRCGSKPDQVVARLEPSRRARPAQPWDPWCQNTQGEFRARR
jgi:hypothetical protein